jgi:hypothetical protein
VSLLEFNHCRLWDTHYNLTNSKYARTDSNHSGSIFRFIVYLEPSKPSDTENNASRACQVSAFLSHSRTANWEAEQKEFHFELVPQFCLNAHDIIWNQRIQLRKKNSLVFVWIRNIEVPILCLHAPIVMATNDCQKDQDTTRAAFYLDSCDRSETITINRDSTLENFGEHVNHRVPKLTT